MAEIERQCLAFLVASAANISDPRWRAAECQKLWIPYHCIRQTNNQLHFCQPYLVQQGAQPSLHCGMLVAVKQACSTWLHGDASSRKPVTRFHGHHHIIIFVIIINHLHLDQKSNKHKVAHSSPLSSCSSSPFSFPLPTCHPPPPLLGRRQSIALASHSMAWYSMAWHGMA